MINGVIFWLIIFALSAVCFFVIAAIVTVKGLADLQALLQHSRQSNKSKSEALDEEQKAE